MNRRDLLKVLGMLPIAGVLQGCARGDSTPAPTPSKETNIHTLQILLEGAFAVVLQKQAQRLTAFVPLPKPGRNDLAHYFCFNDPENPKELNEKTKEFRFELSGDGLHTFSNQNQEKNISPYVNPGFDDFSAETEKWNLPPSLVVLDLPFPRSINFSGRPLDVKFGRKALKKSGKMPTNYILEYRVDDQEKVKLKCNQGEMQCSPSPHCPLGVLRFFFGVGPLTHDPKARQQHAVDFFNFTLKEAFPELQEKYEIASIDPSDYEEPGMSGRTRPVAFKEDVGTLPALLPAVLGSEDRIVRLRRVASLVDCQIGGIIVGTRTAPTK
jgi:hypothetical protein